MTTICDDLRKAVLQAAIQGHLTEQLPEDGNAENLYNEIQAEKQKLIKEGKIKKEKPLPEIMEDDIPFDIPANWKWVWLGSVIHLQSGQDFEPSGYNDKAKGIPYLTGASNLDNGKVIINRWTETPRCLAKTGTLLIVCKGAGVGKMAFLQIPEAHIARQLMGITSSHVALPYIKIVLDMDIANIREKMQGIIPGISRDDILSLLLPLPPLAEQKRIVARVDELMARIDEMEMTEKDIIALSNAFPGDMKAALLQAAIQGKLTGQLASDGDAETLYADIQKEKQKLIKEGKLKKAKTLPEISEDEIPFDIPENWKWVRWGNLSFSIQYGYNAPALQKGRIRMVRISDIQNNAVAWDTVPYCNIEEKDIPDYLLEVNDILFARTGGTVGKSYLVKEVPCESIYAGYLIRTRYSSDLVPSYMKYFMESQLYWDQLKEGTTATAQPNCNGQTLSKMLIPLPPLSEQKRIVEKLDKLFSLCDAMGKDIAGGEAV